MKFGKLLSMILALAMVLGTVAIAESDDLQAQLDAANARVAELEAQVEKYQPVYESQVVAEYGDEGVVLLQDAREEYEAVAQMYAQYGIAVNQYADQIKQSVLTGMVQQAVLDEKSHALGLDQLDDETMADLTALAEEDLGYYVDYYGSYFAKEGATDEENHEAIINGLAEVGYTLDSMLEQRVTNYVNEQLVDSVTADITISDEEVQEAYDTMVADAEANFTDNDYSYNSTRSNGGIVAWNPEGYRAVKHVLIKFNDEQAELYSELSQTLESLEDELAALTEDDEEDAAEETEADAEEEPPRTEEEIKSDIGKVGASLEALYAELLPKAQEVIDAFNNGTDFQTLIDTYGEDPGMQQEPSASQGYAVTAGSEYWEEAFVEGAMSIPEVGGISEPVRGSNGIHIIYYMSDITPGQVPFEEIKDAVEATALETKKTNAYNEQMQAWVAEANPVYHLDRFI